MLGATHTCGCVVGIPLMQSRAKKKLTLHYTTQRMHTTTHATRLMESCSVSDLFVVTFGIRRSQDSEVAAAVPGTIGMINTAQSATSQPEECPYIAIPQFAESAE